MANLQDVLKVLIDRETISLDRDAVPLKAGLASERQKAIYGDSTARIMLIFQEKNKIIARNQVNEATAAAMNKLLEDWGLIDSSPALDPHSPGNHPISKKYLVQGKVLQADGSPLQGVQVLVFFKRMRNEEKAGQSATDRRGNYSINFTPPQSKGGINLILRVYRGEKGKLLASSKIVFNAQPVEKVNIQVSETTENLSKYERITQALKPLLDDRLIRDLREPDEENPAENTFRELTYLAGETDITVDHLSLLVAAEKAGNRTELAPEIFYGLFCKGVSTGLHTLWEPEKEEEREKKKEGIKVQEYLYALGELGEEKVQVTLAQAVEEGLIPATTKIDEQLKKLFKQPEVQLMIKPVFLAKPESLFLPTTKQKGMTSAEQHLITAKLNRKFREILISTAGSLSRSVNRALSRAVNDLEYPQYRNASPAMILRDDILPKLKRNPQLTKDTDNLRMKLKDQGATIAQLLHLDTPMQDNPIFSANVRRAKILSYSGLAGMPDKAKNYLADGDLTPDEQVLASMVKDNLVTEQQADELLLVLDLARLTGDNLPLIKKINNRSFNSTRDMISWSRNDWLEKINAAGDALPPNEKPETYADNILANIEQTYPSQTLLVRMSTQEQTDLDNLTDSANTYRHLKVFHGNNEKLDLRLVNLLKKNDDQINWQGIPEAEQPYVRKKLMDCQRTLALASKTSDQLLLVKNGFDSSLAITRLSESRFIKKSELAKGVGREIYRRAVKTASSVAHVTESIREIGHGGFSDIALANNRRDLSLSNELKEIDGLEDFFGSLNYCACEECSSILGPAAYFVDMMRFIDENITSVVQIEKKIFRNHALNLKRRRPDLWKLNLTCENTYTLVPYLTIVNNVLTDYLLQVFHLKTNDVFRLFSGQHENISFHLPFNLPLAELRIYLGHFDITLYELHRLLDPSSENLWPSRLDFSDQEVQVITTPDTRYIEKRYGSPATMDQFDVQEFLLRTGIDRNQLDELLNLKFNSDLIKIKIEKQYDPDGIQCVGEELFGLTDDRLDFIHRFIRLWKKTGWSIPELDLIFCSLVRKLVINAKAVRQVARLAELQGRLKLSVEELCALVHQLPVSSSFPNKAATSSEERLMDVLFDVEVLFQGNEEDPENAAFNYYHYSLDATPTTPPKQESKTPILLGGLGISETELLLLFALLKESMPFDDKGETTLDREKLSLLYRHAKLSKALKLSIEEFIQAVELLFEPDIHVEDTEDSSQPYTLNVDQIFKLQEFCSWLKSSPFTVFDLAFLIQDNQSGSNTFSTDFDGAAALILEYQQLPSQSFTEELLSEVEGILPEESIAILEQMKTEGMLIADANTYRINPNKYLLTQDFQAIFDELDIRLEVTKKETEIREKLNGYHPFATAYTAHANIDLTTFNQLIRFAETDLSSAEFLTALLTTFDKDGNPVQPEELPITIDENDNSDNSDNSEQSNPLEPVLELLHDLEKTVLLFQKLDLKNEDMRFIADNQGTFGIEELNKMNLEYIQSLTTYSGLMPDNAEEKLTVHALLLNYLLEPPSFACDSAASDLGSIWQVDSSLIDSLIKPLVLLETPPETAVKALDYLRKTLDYCLILGINGYSLYKLVGGDNSYKAIKTARDVALGAFSSKYEDEKIRHEKLEPYHDRINVIKRDALCDYILAREKELKFKDRNDIYSFFLLDVEMSGCFRTSHLVCGLSSLQLYVHRVLANLEQSESNRRIQVLQTLASDEDHLAQIRQEWEWRKNYRVWQANRKVFLYPENYLEPDLRDNKTPIFRELEDELLQEKISKESAETAYTKYLSQFAELARLRIAGNYYHKPSKTYYFFGCTQQSPPQYYYRTWNQVTWTPWEKIELGINAEQVSAVIHRGRLYLFWIERKKKEETEVIDGSSKVTGGTFETIIFYSYLNEENKWLSPQRIDFENFTLDLEYKIGNEIEFFLSYYAYNKYIQLTELETIKCYNRVYLLDNQDDIRFSIVSSPIELLNDQYDDAYTLIDSTENSCYSINFFQNTCEATSILSEEGLQGNFIRLHKGNNVSWFTLHDSITDAGSWKIESPQNIYSDAAEETQVYSSPVSSTYSSPVFTFSSTSYFSPFGTMMQPTPDVIHYSSQFSSRMHPDLDVVHNRLGDYVIKLGNQQFLTQWKIMEKVGGFSFSAPYRNTIRLTTSLVDPLGEKLFDEGLEAFLSLETQQELREDPIKILFRSPWRNPAQVNHIDFTGAYGPYYRELFFQIPFLIAHHLNANQKFAEAKWWYERIFDPTGTEKPSKKNPNDRNWRYLEFRDLSIEGIKDILMDKVAIEKYEEDPFSPHAIARLRMTAYQKTIVMKYIDNLLDWGDSLFTQDTMESINEATMHYVLAADILGKRPVQLGKCGTVSEESLTYENIAADMDGDDDFLLTMENWYDHAPVRRMQDAQADEGASGIRTTSKKIIPNKMQHHAEIVHARISLQATASRQLAVKPPPVPPVFQITEITSSQQVFCVPPNDNLHKYWDRVEDRLFKIRHCMNISGIRRPLALFQPPIDPMMLVRAKAAGLSMDDILSMLGAQLPPYRFSFLLDKAKQYTQTVQSFGSALLSALEKKDVEELTLLRSVHECNIMQWSKKIKEQQVIEAQCQYQATLETKTNVQNRIDYYDGLVAEGLTGWENTQQIAQHTSKGIQIAGDVFLNSSSLLYLIPQLGSWFALKYGGKETGDSAKGFGDHMNQMARIAEAISTSAGLQASWNRREQDWNQQLTLARQELNQVEQQCLAADIRKQIAKTDLKIHRKQIEHTERLDDFYKNKFTNLGLYTYLSTKLNALYRDAYNIAYDMAKMAEKAYQFERDDDSSMLIAGDNWQYDRAGLLAGERLLLQLQHMEKAYLEKNTRRLEMTQSFSLALLDPNALIALRNTGECEEFWIPEIAYDLVYPGQYKRIIKSVRLSIPCVTGPHTNIGATLTLTKGEIRRETDLDKNLEEILHQKNTSIATSSSLNDSGVFELNFRDERYLPFEGAGAISTWNLTLPNEIRQFDYNTISDVVVHISYTALYDGGFKQAVESAIKTKVIEYSQNPGLFRVFSLSHEFPDAFHRLLTEPDSPQSTEIEIKQEHFPYFMTSFTLTTSSVTIFVRLKEKNTFTLHDLQINGKDISFTVTTSGNGEKNDLHEGTTSATGALPGAWKITSGNGTAGGGLKREEIADILIAIKYQASQN
ncbi:hypothetical protein VU12_10755 [Desulfobulbus sp. US4]|nr:hypothetical protein [Desulfobulbus sp. US4]